MSHCILFGFQVVRVDRVGGDLQGDALDDLQAVAAEADDLARIVGDQPEPLDPEGAQILVALGIKRLRLITNNPRKFIGLSGYGLEIVERVPLEIAPNAINADYLKTKKDKMGHILEMV